MITPPAASAAASVPPTDGTDVTVAPLAAAAGGEASGLGQEVHPLLAAREAYQKLTLYLKWKRDNPREHARIEAYWDRGDFFPETINAFGLAYALVADSYHEQTAVMPFAPV